MRVLAFLLFLPAVSFAAPFLTSDPDPTGAADKCVYQRGTATPVESDVVVTAPALTGACRIDLATIPIGQNNLQVWFKSSVWGVESAKVPLAFAKPVAGGPGPTGLKIVP
jgi:hypothetical protein